jgi:hypothetical protein
VQRLEAMRPVNRTGLPDTLKAGIESMSGVALDSVRVHRNSPKPAQLNAHAYAQGSEIHLAPGQEQHLPHEAWHVVQQARGQVRPTRQLKGGTPINDDVRLEHEADVMGARAMAAPVQRKAHSEPRSYGFSHSAIQRIAITDEESGGSGAFDTENADEVIGFLADCISDEEVAGAVEQKVWDSIREQLARQDGPYGVNRNKIQTDFAKVQLALESADVVGELEDANDGSRHAVDERKHALEQKVHEGPLAKIVNDPLLDKNKTVEGNSRVKVVYLFDANGDPTKDKKSAVYMVDSTMDEDEYRNYLLLATMGLRAPEIYGVTKKGGHPIVQRISNHITAGGAGARPLLPNVKNAIEGANGEFNIEKWSNTLADVETLIAAQITSKDLQFMVADSGHVYLMDLEPDNAPRFNKVDGRLIELKEYLDKAIQKGGPPEQEHKDDEEEVDA